MAPSEEFQPTTLARDGHIHFDIAHLVRGTVNMLRNFSINITQPLQSIWETHFSQTHFYLIFKWVLQENRVWDLLFLKSHFKFRFLVDNLNQPTSSKSHFKIQFY